MENRIDEHKRRPRPLKPAIVAAEIAVSTEKDTEENAKAILERSVNEDEMHTDWEGEPVLTGNPLGVNIGIFQRNQTALLQKVGSDASRIGTLESQNEALMARLEDLELAVVEFDELRGRFISNFKKKRGVATLEDHENVRGGNRIAHTGSVKRDSGLYRAHGRKDFSAFKTLYGFHPAIAATIDYPPTINALNRHASILCETSSDEELPQPFHKSFESFTASLDAAEFAEFDLGPLESQPSPCPHQSASLSSDGTWPNGPGKACEILGFDLDESSVHNTSRSAFSVFSIA